MVIVWVTYIWHARVCHKCIRCRSICYFCQNLNLLKFALDLRLPIFSNGWPLTLESWPPFICAEGPATCWNLVQAARYLCEVLKSLTNFEIWNLKRFCRIYCSYILSYKSINQSLCVLNTIGIVHTAGFVMETMYSQG